MVPCRVLNRLEPGKEHIRFYRFTRFKLLRTLSSLLHLYFMFITIRLVVFKIYVCYFVCVIVGLYQYKAVWFVV